MSPAQRMTAWFATGSAVAFICSWVIYDLWVYHRHGNNATISRVMLDMGRRWPFWIVLWVAPVVAAIVHFWGSQTTCGDDDDPGNDDEGERS